MGRWILPGIARPAQGEVDTSRNTTAYTGGGGYSHEQLGLQMGRWILLGTTQHTQDEVGVQRNSSANTRGWILLLTDRPDKEEGGYS